MSSAPTSRVTSSAASHVAPPEIERLFQTSLFLLIVTGFATLASTGKLDLVSSVFVLCALVLRGYLLLRDIPFVIPRRVTSWLAVIYFLLFFVDFFFLSGRDVVTPAVHLVLFGMCVKLFNVERERDYFYLAVLSFLMVLAAAILTVDSGFLAAFGIFIVLAVFCFMVSEMRRSARLASNATTLAIPGLRTRRRIVSPMQRLSGSLVRTAALMVAAILTTGAVLFFAMPRISGGYLSRYAQSDAISVGFSDSVNLGEIGHIQQSSEVVAHIHIDGDTSGYHEIRLRGGVLTLFDGKRWTNPRGENAVLAQGFGRVFQLSSRATTVDRREEVRLARGPQLDPIRYRILMEPLNTNIIFTIPAAQALFGSFREISVDDDRIFHNLDRERVVSIYEGVSDVSVPSPMTLDRLSAAMPPSIPDRYFQLPPVLDPRIPELAHKLTDSEPSTYRRALAIQNYLRTQFGYTLQLPTQATTDPLADFLFRRHRGHCEYFASSMAVLLRTVGIPSRVITGFRGAQFNEVNSTYIVRASDAHSWVEAFIPGAGWTTFDPTPAGNTPAMTAWTRAQLYLDAAREFWREWIVNYDAGHQQNLSVAGIRKTRSRIAAFRDWSIRQYERMLQSARRVHEAATHDPMRLLRPGLKLLAVLLLCALPFAVVRIGKLWRAASPRSSPRSASAILYLRMTRRLARRGYPRAPTQTPSEFAASIGDPTLRESVVRFTSVYEEARFGGSATAAANLPVLLEEVRNTLTRS
jgi:transglutaminase-like putative cysteine protease